MQSHVFHGAFFLTLDKRKTIQKLTAEGLPSLCCEHNGEASFAGIYVFSTSFLSSVFRVHAFEGDLGSNMVGFTGTSSGVSDRTGCSVPKGFCPGESLKTGAGEGGRPAEQDDGIIIAQGLGFH